MKYLLVTCAAICVAGCSSSGPAPQTASVTGTFAGQALDIADSAGFQGSSATSAYLGVVLSSAPGVCSVARQHAAMASASRLQLLIEAIGQASPPPLTAGSYAITNGDPAATGYDPAAATTTGVLVVSATYNSLDANCVATLAPTATGATSGTITLDTVSPTDVAGSFDLHFPGGDRLTGRFSSPVCGGEQLAFSPAAGGTGAEDPIASGTAADAPQVTAAACLP